MVIKGNPNTINTKDEKEIHFGQSSRLGYAVHYIINKNISVRSSLFYKRISLANTNTTLTVLGNYFFRDIESQSNIFYDINYKNAKIHFGVGPNVSWSMAGHYQKINQPKLIKTDELKQIHYAVNSKIGVSRKGFGIFVFFNTGIGNRNIEKSNLIRNNDLFGINISYLFQIK